MRVGAFVYSSSAPFSAAAQLPMCCPTASMSTIASTLPWAVARTLRIFTDASARPIKSDFSTGSFFSILRAEKKTAGEKSDLIGRADASGNIMFFDPILFPDPHGRRAEIGSEEHTPAIQAR